MISISLKLHQKSFNVTAVLALKPFHKKIKIKKRAWLLRDVRRA
jgi:hypothetical protein